MGVLHRYDYDDVFFRSVSIGLINLLTNKLHIWHRQDDTKYIDVPVPFFYDHAGDERFIQDMFFGNSLDDCVDLKQAEASYDKIPRGHIKLTSASINASMLTNRFVRGEFRKENDKGQLITYNAPINHIPLDLSFEVKMVLDGELGALKIWQRLIEVFYKIHIFSFLWGGFVIKAQVGFPESHDLSKSPATTYGEDKQLEIPFNLEVQTFLPVIDTTLEFRKDVRIEQFNVPITPDRFKKGYKYAWDMNEYYQLDIKPVGNTKLEIKIDETKVKYIPSDSNKIIK